MKILLQYVRAHDSGDMEEQIRLMESVDEETYNLLSSIEESLVEESLQKQADLLGISLEEYNEKIVEKYRPIFKNIIDNFEEIERFRKLTEDD